MQQSTKDKMAQILADAQAKANNVKSFKDNPTPAPVKKQPTQAKPIVKDQPAAAPQNRPELSTMTSADFFTPTPAPEVKPEVNTGPTPAETPVSIVDYSEKAFAVIGETKPIKDKLGAAGGRFNYNLKCGPGWIFSKSRLAQVQKLLNIAA